MNTPKSVVIHELKMPQDLQDILEKITSAIRTFTNKPKTGIIRYLQG
jgi:hypothetical protein